MTIKNLTTDQIQADLANISRTWPGGIPPEQNDRVNALKGELKKRGEPLRAAPKAPAQPSEPSSSKRVQDMSSKELESELGRLAQVLGNSPSDDESQERFADVRFEMRKRAKMDNGPDQEVEAPTTPSVTPRAIDIPDEVETPAPKAAQKPATTTARGIGPINLVVSADAKVVVRVLAQDAMSVAQVASVLTIEQAGNLVEMLQATIIEAKALRQS
jgi:hypothetical protein